MLRIMVLAWVLGASWVGASQGAEAPPAKSKPAESKPAAKPSTKPKDAPAAADTLPADWVERIVRQCQKSVVVITVTGRDGKQDGLGSGFVVSSDGLIATNLHVIGEARPIQVRTNDGKRYDVTSVEATDRVLDLALVRVNARDLPALPLGDSDKLRQGQRVVALGNPLGLEHSVVSGVVSGSREIDGRPMIQLAIPIEPGNSGGPLLDDQGQVHGLLTMKSLVTANLGFAVKVNALKPLVEKPNPVPMTQWLTIGTLDPQEWTTLFGSTWRQRAGRLSVEGKGAGFGGRSLCLAVAEPPRDAYEVSVSVKLNDESGAAGLVFAADGQDRHYGFYPSNGRMRLSRFDGPDVLSWNVLHEAPHASYQPHDWNTIKVRVESDKMQCWLNEQLVIESTDVQYRGGRVGLAKFRDTQAEFRGFRVAERLPSTIPAPDVVTRIEKSVANLASAHDVEDKQVDALAKDALAAQRVLLARAKRLEAEAEQLRVLAQRAHRRQVEQQLVRVLDKPDEKADLLHAALLVAKLDNAELDVDAYRAEVERLARSVQAKLKPQATPPERLAALNQFLFKEQGFHGSRGDYENRSNSYLNEVLDDREGLPITLAVLYMELGSRLGLKIVGLGIPGQFMVRYEPEQGEPLIVSPFDSGETLSRDALAKKIRDNSGDRLRDEHLVAVTKRQIIERMLRNLLGNATRSEKPQEMLQYLDALLAVVPDALQERLMRAVVHYRSGTPQLGLRDTTWLLDNKPEGVDLDRVLELHHALERAAAKRQESSAQ